MGRWVFTLYGNEAIIWARCYVHWSLEAIVKVQPHGPYKIAGNSMGTLIAYEIAYQLEQEGEIVEEVMSMDMPAVKLDVFKSYATAPSFNEKGNTLVAHVLGD